MKRKTKTNQATDVSEHFYSGEDMKMCSISIDSNDDLLCGGGKHFCILILLHSFGARGALCVCVCLLTSGNPKSSVAPVVDNHFFGSDNSDSRQPAEKKRKKKKKQEMK